MFGLMIPQMCATITKQEIAHFIDAEDPIFSAIATITTLEQNINHRQHKS